MFSSPPEKSESSDFSQLQMLITTFDIKKKAFEETCTYIPDEQREKQEKELIAEHSTILMMIFENVRNKLPNDSEKYQELTVLLQRLSNADSYENLQAVEQEAMLAINVVKQHRNSDTWWGSFYALFFNPNTYYQSLAFMEDNGKFTSPDGKIKVTLTG